MSNLNVAGKFTIVNASGPLHNGPGVQVEALEIEGPNGRFTREVVRRPHAVAMLCEVNGKVLFVKQYRAPIDKENIELPAGKVDVNENPMTAAARELVEETGYQCLFFHKVISFNPTPGYSDEVLHIYRTGGGYYVGTAREGEEEQEMEVLHIAKEDIPAMVKHGKITDGKTLLALSMCGYLNEVP